MKDRDVNKEWRGGFYLCTAKTSLEADIFESKLKSENIPCVRRYKGASFMEAAFGASTTFPIDLYVPKEKLEDAHNVILPVPLDECEPVDFDED
jgi:hypothetical protein